ncbi:pilus assembly protein TadG-related protein [Streptomyces luomodiensis]|uniref:Pilus assembly protein TadG-related protein n=1 Tax=Streptomyces luomodiensis TaxID=3026192 RepID=A0ABY9V9E2_9ACTN|nr:MULTISPECIES: pilus assembly protein TadG-related protein [unclassified Streptomyces]WAP58034.1 pilus assembly protein TadG-related protein [Streptomyces sp. S465]WNE98589.1 pilus assembly protein TadG-related protein [Streptomyces sp. SCA4-21]
MTARRDLRSDAGQAFPIYITAVAGLLFLALALFAVGQAGATRNGGQTAADAAALAAAQDYRDQLRKGFLEAIANGSAWEDLLSGRGLGGTSACDEAQWFADQNGADVTDCQGPDFLPTSFTVTVRTHKPVGKTVIPGTENKHAEATAKAVVTPRCTAEEPAPPTKLPDEDGGGGKDDGGKDDDEGGDGGKDDGKDDKPPIDLRCDGVDLTIDPTRLDLFPDAKDLFSVHLAD